MVSLRGEIVTEEKLKQYDKAVLRAQVTYNPLTSVILASGEIFEDPLAIHLPHTEHY